MPLAPLSCPPVVAANDSRFDRVDAWLLPGLFAAPWFGAVLLGLVGGGGLAG